MISSNEDRNLSFVNLKCLCLTKATAVAIFEFCVKEIKKKTKKDCKGNEKRKSVQSFSLF